MRESKEKEEAIGTRMQAGQGRNGECGIPLMRDHSQKPRFLSSRFSRKIFLFTSPFHLCNRYRKTFPPFGGELH
ncbi:MAG: hypothetical protein HC767_15310 [Akkermansiaceae bacterium]|nr:hypothetical protein [Akkermansiaceae bacterium]